MGTWTLTFKNWQKKDCVVTIYGTDTDKTLTPAVQPFTTQGNDDEDFFKPIRSESGYISVITKVNELSLDWGENIVNHKVILTIDGSIKWLGYIKQDVYTQPYEPGYIKLDFAVVGVLEAMSGVYTDEYSGTQLQFAYVIDYFLKDMDIDQDLGFIYFSSRINPHDVLNKYIQFADLFPAEDGKVTYSWGEIWENICNCWGWQMQMEGDSIYFLSRDCNNGQMYRITYSDMFTTDFHEGTINLTNKNSIASNIAGMGHTFSTYQGKKKIVVTGEPGVLDTEIWKLDSDSFKCIARGYEPNDTAHYHYDFGTTIGDEVTCYLSNATSAPLWKSWLKSRNKNDVASFGGGIEALGWLSVKNVTGEGYQYDSWTWFKGLTITPSSNTGFMAIKIKPKKIIRTFNSTYYLKIKGKIRTITSWSNLFVDSYKTLTLPVRLKFGNKYVQQGTLEEETWTTAPNNIFLIAEETEDGKFVKFGPAFPSYVNNGPIEDRDVAAYVKLPAGEVGQVELDIYAPATAGSRAGYLIEELSIELFSDTLMYTQSFQNEVNEESRLIGNGYKDEYSVSSVLTCSRECQMGPGVILCSPTTDQNGVVEYMRAKTLEPDTEKTPEESYADRLEAYYASAYKVYKVKAKALYGLHYTITIGGTTYFIVAQDIDWRTGDTTLTLIEKK